MLESYNKTNWNDFEVFITNSSIGNFYALIFLYYGYKFYKDLLIYNL